MREDGGGGMTPGILIFAIGFFVVIIIGGLVALSR